MQPGFLSSAAGDKPADDKGGEPGKPIAQGKPKAKPKPTPKAKTATQEATKVQPTTIQM